MRCCRNPSLLAGLLLLGLSACRPAEKQAVLPAPSNTTIEQVASVHVDEAPLTLLSAEVKPGEAVIAATAGEQPVEAPAVKRPPLQKLLVMADRQPLLLEVYLWIDGRPFDEALAALSDKVINMADTDGDGISTWDELAENPEFNRGQLGSLSFSNPQERARLINLYDVNRNGRVDADETPRLLTRNRGKAREFSVDPRAYSTFRRSREQSDVLRLLDQDRDLRLSSDEMENADELLRAHDVDADGIISAAELAPPRSPMMGMSANADWRGELGAFVLDENTNWPQVLRSLETIYNFGSAIEIAAVFGADSPLTMIDEDQDGYLEFREVSRCAQLRPAVTVEIRFGQRAAGEEFLTLAISSDAACQLQETAFVESMALVEGNGRMLIHAADDVNSVMSNSQAQNLLQIYDQDKNEYLEKEELPENAVERLPFAAIDADDDGKVTLEELSTALANVDLVKACQIRVQRIGMLDPLFTVLDENGDGRLATRELRDAAKKLREMDADGDQEVSPDELPAFGGLAIYRGGDRDGSTLPPREVQKPVQGRPDWHSGMDFNGDGDISWAEFLGNRTQFEELDRDGDGLLSVVEVGTKSI